MRQTSDQPILCGIDGSLESHVAAKLVARLADRLGVPLVLAHIVPMTAAGPPPVGGAALGQAALVRARDSARASGRHLLENVAAELKVDAALELAPGHPSRRLRELSHETGAQLLVLGAHARGPVARAIRGTAWCRLAAQSRSAVGVVRSSAEVSCEGLVVVGYDGAPHSERAVAVASELAARLGQPLRAVSVYRFSYARRRAPTVGRQSLLRADWERREVQPSRELSRAADAADAAFLVIGSRGRGPRRSAVLGSVSAAVAEHGTRPVVVVQDTNDR
jgi:nucleotide-binding universal stress UspA family protein